VNCCPNLLAKGRILDISVGNVNSCCDLASTEPTTSSRDGLDATKGFGLSVWRTEEWVCRTRFTGSSLSSSTAGFLLLTRGVEEASTEGFRLAGTEWSSLDESISMTEECSKSFRGDGRFAGDDG
jgi:hypothetical protein